MKQAGLSWPLAEPWLRLLAFQATRSALSQVRSCHEIDASMFVANLNCHAGIALGDSFIAGSI